jgi:hypothetical protein
MQVNTTSVSHRIDFCNCLDKQEYICIVMTKCRNYKNFIALFRGLRHTPAGIGRIADSVHTKGRMQLSFTREASV